MTERLKSYKFRIYPDETQRVILAKTFGSVRFVWNSLVANFNSYGEDSFKDKLSEKELKLEFNFLSEVSAATLQQKRMDFNETKSQFFNAKRKKKLGRMKLKRKHGRQSFRLPNQKFRITSGFIRLEKIGFVKCLFDRDLSGKDLRSVTVSLTPSGKYFASILVKEDIGLLDTTGKVVGVDVGIKEFATLSNGSVIKNPKWFRESQSKLKKAQKHLSRKVKGSARYNKQKIKVAKVHEKIANQRKHFHHEISTRLVRSNDVICIEDLNVSGMVKNRKLSKSISDAGWSEFYRMIEYKSLWYGRSFVRVDRFYPSSKTCSACNHKVESMDLSVREWGCPKCKAKHDRDLNAAINICNKGYFDLTSAELVDYSHGEHVRLFDSLNHLAKLEEVINHEFLYL